MKKNCFLFSFFVFLLAACSQSGVKADVPNTPQAKAAQVLVEQYIHALTTYDFAPLDSLLSDDYVYTDYGRFVRPESKDNLILLLQEDMSTRSYKVEFPAYTVTSDGRFAVLQAIYSEKSPATGKWVSAPMYDVVEIKDGKIIAETMYYNKENYH